MDEQIIGYLILHFGYDTDHSRRDAKVDDLFVTERWRGKGAGEALMKGAAEVAQSHGAEALWWGVYEHNKSAIRFYETLGARHVKDMRFMSIDIESLRSSS